MPSHLNGEMDNIGTNSRNTTRTDLTLLLECLKFQMKRPDLQKQALLTIHSICERREDNVHLLGEMGGVTFVYNLSKSSIVCSDVKETALFTLGTLAEANVYCKNYLCTKEIFTDLTGCLMKQDIPLTQKRVSVYLLSVLVANHKAGQTLSQTTGCLDILLDLFKTTSPLSAEATSRAAHGTQIFQLWTSVSSALCGCVNNPQNEEAQRVCVSAFPTINVWLHKIALPRPEIYQPICSFIAMTVANNSCVQDSFSASGCLDTLGLALVRLASNADTSVLSCQLSVTVSKTLSACITENSSLASGLSQYGVVSHLFSLLVSPHLDPGDRLSVLLTLGHCTEASEVHQAQLVQCGALPLIITLLTEDTSEDVRRTATFILESCKWATASLNPPEVTENQGQNVEHRTDVKGFRSSARDLLSRIELLEKSQAKAEDEQKDSEPVNPTRALDHAALPPASALPLQHKSTEAIPTIYRPCSTAKHAEGRKLNIRKMNTITNDSELKRMSTNLNMQEEKENTTGGHRPCSACNGTGTLMSSHNPSLEGVREPHTADNITAASATHSVPKEMKSTDEERFQGNEMNKIPVEECSCSHNRCAACVLPFEEVTSRTFEALQSSCRHSCDMHKVLNEATENFRTRRRNHLLRREYLEETVEPPSERGSAAQPQRSCENWKVPLTPTHRGAEKGKRSLQHRKKHNVITLTPMRGGPKRTLIKHGPGLTPLKRSHLHQERRGRHDSGNHSLVDKPKSSTEPSSTRRKRRDFSREEVRYLQRGVKTYGFSWKSILWAFPFQPGRTNVDLAKKYRRLMEKASFK